MTTSHASAPVPEPGLMTAEDLAALPDDGNQYELDEGRLVVMPPSKNKPSRVALRLGGRMELYCEANDLGYCMGPDGGVVLQRGPDTVRAPDISFIRKERWEGVGSGYFEGAPDLAVEVLSPSDRFAAVVRKIRQYLQAGTRLVWVLDPEDRTAVIFRADGSETYLDEHGVLDGEDVLPGFTLSLSEIWV